MTHTQLVSSHPWVGCVLKAHGSLLVPGLIDTGADRTAACRKLLDRIRAPVVGHMPVRSLHGLRSHAVRRVTLRVGKARECVAHVLELDALDHREMIVGRDALSPRYAVRSESGLVTIRRARTRLRSPLPFCSFG